VAVGNPEMIGGEIPVGNEPVGKPEMGRPELGLEMPPVESGGRGGRAELAFA